MNHAFITFSFGQYQYITYEIEIFAIFTQYRATSYLTKNIRKKKASQQEKEQTHNLTVQILMYAKYK